MNTIWIKEIDQTLDQNAIEKAGQIIRAGGLVAFPTETVYGLGGDALNPDSSEKIYRAKGRPSDNPLIVHIAKLSDLSKIAKHIPPVAYKLAEHFWPGPLTMIFEKQDCVPSQTTGGLNTVAVRFPDHEVARRFIEAAGGFVAAPSANTSGRPSPTLGKYVYEDMNGKIEMLLDGGQVGIGVESTIVDVTQNPPMILRPGHVTSEMLTELLGQVQADPTMFEVKDGTAPKAPGMKYKHYAPKGELTIVSGQDEEIAAYILEQIEIAKKEGKRVGVITSPAYQDTFLADSVKVTGDRQDSQILARDLFKFLREFDDEQIDLMYVSSVQQTGIGQAVMNRMLKAAGHKVIDAVTGKQIDKL